VERASTPADSALAVAPLPSPGRAPAFRPIVPTGASLPRLSERFAVPRPGPGARGDRDPVLPVPGVLAEGSAVGPLPAARVASAVSVPAPVLATTTALPGTPDPAPEAVGEAALEPGPLAAAEIIEPLSAEADVPPAPQVRAPSPSPAALVPPGGRPPFVARLASEAITAQDPAAPAAFAVAPAAPTANDDPAPPAQPTVILHDGPTPNDEPARRPRGRRRASRFLRRPR
jgi:hypothetical protein